MDAVWIVLGCVLLGVTLLDTFLAVLNYDEAGLFVNRIVRWQWFALRAVTRRVGRRWRPLLLRQVTGILLVTTILWWLVGIVLGFTFIYLGAMGVSGVFQISSGVTADFLGAFYLSFGQFATVGVDNISPGVAWMNMLTVTEAMVSLVLLSFIITFLGNVYGVIQSLRAFSANFFRAGRGIGDPVDTLAPFFPDGTSRGLDGQLDSILDSLSAYSDGLAQNRAAYYFQSGRDQFSLPFSIYMTGGVIAALRWGLPAGSDSTKEPGLVRLTEAFEDFRLRMQRMLGWSSATVPVPVSAADFASAAAVFAGPGSNSALDPWVLRFLATDRRMAALTHDDAEVDPAEAYPRYAAWLPFEVQAQTFLAAVSRDLDYQPIYRGIATTPDGIPLDGEGAGYTLEPMVVDVASAARSLRPAARGRSPLVAWIRRRHLFIDPGYVRLADAVRTLAAVVVAIGGAVALASTMGWSRVDAAVLAGLIALFSGPLIGGWGRGARRVIGLFAVIPAGLGLAAGVFLPRDPVWAVVAIAVIAALAVWVRRFGPRVGGFGQLLFVTYYFALLLAIPVDAALPAVATTAIGLAAMWLVNLVPGPGRKRQIDGGVSALYERVAVFLDALADVASTGRRDKRLVRTLRSEQAALRSTVGFITGHLDADPADGVGATRARALRVRVFDVQLASENLLAVLPDSSSIAITVEERALLAAAVVEVQQHARSFRRGDASPSHEPAPRSPSTEDWPSGARSILSAIVETRTAVDALREAQLADEEKLQAMGGDIASADGDASARDEATTARAGGPAGDRLAVQAGLSTGIALFLGGFVSTSHQYWTAMPAFQVLSGSDGETRIKGIQRVLATILGAGIAFGLAIAADHSPLVAFPLMVVSVFFMAFLRSVASAWTAFWQTILLATMYDVLGTLTVETEYVRIAETAIGAVVAILVSALVLPTRTRTRVLSGMADVVAEARTAATGLFARARRDPSSTPATLGALEREAARELDAVEHSARSLRHDPGALDGGGIEAQLTALWSLLSYERRAGEAVRAHPTAGDPALWARLETMTGSNFAGALDVLAGRLPRRLHPAGDFAVDLGKDADETARRFLADVQRVNQTLLSFVDAVRPGSSDDTTVGPDGTQPAPAPDAPVGVSGSGTS